MFEQKPPAVFCARGMYVHIRDTSTRLLNCAADIMLWRLTVQYLRPSLWWSFCTVCVGKVSNYLCRDRCFWDDDRWIDFLISPCIWCAFYLYFILSNSSCFADICLAQDPRDHSKICFTVSSMIRLWKPEWLPTSCVDHRFTTHWLMIPTTPCAHTVFLQWLGSPLLSCTWSCHFALSGVLFPTHWDIEGPFSVKALVRIGLWSKLWKNLNGYQLPVWPSFYHTPIDWDHLHLWRTS